MEAGGDARATDAGAGGVALGTVAREWGRLGCIGFGGPPAHIALLRELCVERRRWLSAHELEDAIAACNLLPGPASTQLAIYTAWRLRGSAGALVGGVGFILPGLVAILALAALFLAGSPPLWIEGAAAGAGAGVAAVAVQAGLSPGGPSPRGGRGRLPSPPPALRPGGAPPKLRARAPAAPLPSRGAAA